MSVNDGVSHLKPPPGFPIRQAARARNDRYMRRQARLSGIHLSPWKVLLAVVDGVVASGSLATSQFQQLAQSGDLVGESLNLRSSGLPDPAPAPDNTDLFKQVSLKRQAVKSRHVAAGIGSFEIELAGGFWHARSVPEGAVTVQREF